VGRRRQFAICTVATTICCSCRFLYNTYNNTVYTYVRTRTILYVRSGSLLYYYVVSCARGGVFGRRRRRRRGSNETTCGGGRRAAETEHTTGQTTRCRIALATYSVIRRGGGATRGWGGLGTRKKRRKKVGPALSAGNRPNPRGHLPDPITHLHNT